jgi:hypothetical protein
MRNAGEVATVFGRSSEDPYAAGREKRDGLLADPMAVAAIAVASVVCLGLILFSGLLIDILRG